MTTPRIVCSFSCGAASAVATYLTIQDHKGTGREVVVVNADVEEEHPDNRRFLRDCEKWFGRKVTVLRDEKYGASIKKLFLKKRFIIGPGQAPCSGAMKRDVINAWYRPTDEIVIGYTAEEEERANRFIDANNERVCYFPLIEKGLTKGDCLSLVERAGIEMPEMYRLGFNNANCVGCVKGGQAYWNKIKEVFPAEFQRMAEIEKKIGASILRYRSGPRKGEKMPLYELQPTKRKISDEPDISCSAHCEFTEVMYW